MKMIILTAHSVLHRAQHGFVRGRSVCSNLLESLNDWTVYVQSRNQTTIIYVDFSKAFDVVSHEKLFIGLVVQNWWYCPVVVTAFLLWTNSSN